MPNTLKRQGSKTYWTEACTQWKRHSVAWWGNGVKAENKPPPQYIGRTGRVSGKPNVTHDWMSMVSTWMGDHHVLHMEICIYMRERERERERERKRERQTDWQRETEYADTHTHRKRENKHPWYKDRTGRASGKPNVHRCMKSQTLSMTEWAWSPRGWVTITCRTMYPPWDFS